MKKVFIGCAAVLLSLGLLAGCDSEEGDKAVSIKVDNAATVVVGDILELPYTVEPEKAKIEVLNEYEEYVIADAEDGVLYLEGLSEGSATITLVGTYRKYTEANVNISVSVITKEEEDTGPEPVPTPDTPTVSFSLSQTSCDLTVDETIEIEYTLSPSDASVEITSGEDDYVTAEVGTGVISLTGKSEGTTTVSVTASYEGYISATETISVSVTQGTVAVTGVTIDQGSQLTLAAGATTTLTATVYPEGATNPVVTWAVTGDEGVITLDTTTGEVTAGSESGSTTVTVTTVDGNYTASITITVVAAVTPEIESIAFDSAKSYSVEVGEELDVGTYVVATWKDNVTGDTPEYVFSMAENDYASLSGSVITGVASTYGLSGEALPVVTASIQGDTNVSPASQAITVTEAATLTGISFTEQLPTSVNAGESIDLSQYISITGTGDNWESLANNAHVTYGLETTSAASINDGVVTTVSNITDDASITVTAKLADYTDATTATATISVVAPLTIVSAEFSSQSYDLTIGTEKDFTNEIKVTYNKEGSITYEVALSADPSTNLDISGTTVTATGSVESATLTATITWEGGSTTCTTTISAAVTELHNLTMKITIQNSDGSAYVCPDYGSLYLVGDFDKDGNSWSYSTPHELDKTNASSGVYTYTIDSIDVSEEWYYCNILFCYTGHQLSWEPIFNDNFYLVITADLGDDYTYDVGTKKIDTVYGELGGSISAYFMIIDTSSSGTESTLYVKGDDNQAIFVNNGDTYHNWDNATKATTGTTNVACAYNNTAASVEINGTYYVGFHAGDDDYCSINFTVPTTCTAGGTYTYVVSANFSYFGSSSKNSQTAGTGTWYEGAPTTVLTSL